VWRASLVALVALSAIAAADDAPPPDARAQLAAQLADEQSVIDTTRATIIDKLAAADAVRLARLRAAYRLVRAPLPADASATDRLASSRRRAGARLLLERDRVERGLLAQELALLAAATERTVVATRALPEIVLPTELAWPASGTIARRFGTITHERSKTTLARRGLDLEVEAKSSASAPAAGTIRYAGPIRGLDLGVIIDHGDYFTVIAKLGELAVPTGARIAAGDRLGRAARHRIYLEVRVKIGPGGLPIDPEPLLGQSSSESSAAPRDKSR
jgi:septal ring factor EnvC (AmiA/AmiB activator)